MFQCLLFYREGDEEMSGTLAGNKKKVYVLLKILKKCTDASITSFKVSHIFQLAWPQLGTQASQNSAWAKATTAFIFMCVCVSH